MDGIKKQQIERLYRETFSECINLYGEKNFFFCGKKMYIRIRNKIIISVELQGNDTAYNNIVLMAIAQYGILDQNITPFKMIFKESKSEESGQEKLVSLRTIMGVTGEYTVIWSAQLTEQDIMALNNFLMTYVDLFSVIANL